MLITMKTNNKKKIIYTYVLLIVFVFMSCAREIFIEERQVFSNEKYIIIAECYKTGYDNYKYFFIQKKEDTTKKITEIIFNDVNYKKIIFNTSELNDTIFIGCNFPFILNKDGEILNSNIVFLE
jgi:hypothetical protein